MAAPRLSTSHSDEIKVADIETKDNASVEQIDFIAYYENNAGRLVVDPEYVFLLHLGIN